MRRRRAHVLLPIVLSRAEAARNRMLMLSLVELATAAREDMVDVCGWPVRLISDPLMPEDEIWCGDVRVVGVGR